jgi:predicted nuclease with TOPRIM domain
MNRQHCANSKINGCDKFVTQRGNILCEICMEKRKNICQNRREFDFDELMIKYRDVKDSLDMCKVEISNLQTVIERLEKEKINLNESLTKLLEEKNSIELREIKLSQIELDNEKLIIDNKQMKINNENLILQNEILTKQNEEFIEKINNEKINNEKKKTVTVPQTARNRIGSRIPELRKN